MDRLLVGDHIGLSIVGGQRRFAQHIVGVAEAFVFQLTGVGQRFGDGFAGDELLAHQAHRHIDAFTNQRFAAFADNTVQRARQAGFVMGGDQLAGKQQPPGGGVDEQRRAAADMRLPVAVADFVADQGIAGGFVGNAQQRFRQAHQGHAFLRGERELLQQALHHSGAAAGGFLIAQLLRQLIGELVRLFAESLRQASLLQQHRHGVGFGPAPGGGDRRAGNGLRQDLLGEIEEGLIRFVSRMTGLIAFVRRAGQQRRQLRQRLVVFQLFQIVENGLFNQPVRRAVNTARRGFNAFTRRVVKFYTHGGGAHVRNSCNRTSSCQDEVA